MKIAEHYWVIGPLDWILRQSQNLQPATSVRFALRTLVCQRIVLQTSISTSVSQLQILKSFHGRGQIFCQASRSCPTAASLRNLLEKMKVKRLSFLWNSFFFHIYVYLFHLKCNNLVSFLTDNEGRLCTANKFRWVGKSMCKEGSRLLETVLMDTTPVGDSLNFQSCPWRFNA